MKEPGPDHPITITPSAGRWRVSLEGQPLGESERALELKEASYPVVLYFPREDLEMGFFAKTAKHTTCPYKGEASYYTAHANGVIGEDCAWSYETPYPAMKDITGYLAFYPNKVTIEAA